MCFSDRRITVHRLHPQHDDFLLFSHNINNVCVTGALCRLQCVLHAYSYTHQHCSCSCVTHRGSDSSVHAEPPNSTELRAQSHDVREHEADGEMNTGGRGAEWVCHVFVVVVFYDFFHME